MKKSEARSRRAVYWNPPWKFMIPYILILAAAIFGIVKCSCKDKPTVGPLEEDPPREQRH